ncbi:hypothetical protein [Hymenobacter cellulosilyticus]|uniref:Lipocalin-like domain-containing protein n=1 Tax=Hymenobacter cellulosilyticus TaxID=2932248 RepID=A0A8T9QDI4_9BACT|nr:hypothetical protein [Hymenobacter cellulosilyticus]UOQ73629.1 hypothetical protein MUN79_06795 [Hymenobacter cellulosilyticus]
MKRLPIAVLALACAFTGCKKDNEDTPAPAQSKTDMLTSKRWRVIADVSTETINGKTTSYDEFADYEACEKDNFTKFSPDKTLKVDEGTLKCDPSADQQSSGTWDFNSDQSKLLLASPDLGGLTVPFELVELNSTTIKLRLTQTFGTDPNKETYTETYTFSAF